jgi:hypothetical protein
VIECLLEAADRALYQMKHSGGAVVTAPVRFKVGLGLRSGTLCFDHPRSPFLGRRTVWELRLRS